MGNDLFFGVIFKWQLEGLQFLALLYWLDFSALEAASCL